MNYRASLTDVAAVALLRENNSVLLQHRDDKPGLNHAGLWVLPGGHREPSETIEQCARREFFEETAYQCKDLHWLLSCDVETDKGNQYQLAVFWALYDEKQPVRCLEGQDLKFVKREDASTLRQPEFLTDLWDRSIVAAQVQREHHV